MYCMLTSVLKIVGRGISWIIFSSRIFDLILNSWTISKNMFSVLTSARKKFGWEIYWIILSIWIFYLLSNFWNYLEFMYWTLTSVRNFLARGYLGLFIYSWIFELFQKICTARWRQFTKMLAGGEVYFCNTNTKKGNFQWKYQKEYLPKLETGQKSWRMQNALSYCIFCLCASSLSWRQWQCIHILKLVLRHNKFSICWA